MQAGFEMGISEPTTLELSDGTVVMLCRNQQEESISFAYAYSTDHGVNWSEPVASKVFGPNTQPMFQDLEGLYDLFMWAGNNQYGGTSYARWPMNVGIPVVAEDTRMQLHHSNLESMES